MTFIFFLGNNVMVWVMWQQLLIPVLIMHQLWFSDTLQGNVSYTNCVGNDTIQVR